MSTVMSAASALKSMGASSVDDPMDGPFTPGPNDVLCGRDKKSFNHCKFDIVKNVISPLNATIISS